MVVLAKRKPAFVQECSGCFALLGYNIPDIYQNKYVYCPVCRTKLTTNIDLSYDGVIKDGSNGQKKQK